MIQTVTPTQSPVAPQSAAPNKPVRVWGLTSTQLHDAYWRARGVQCVRRGGWIDLQRGAELFLLIEPTQLVLFDVSEMTERLTWHDAAVTRLRLLDSADHEYSERVVRNDRNIVERIERRYTPRVRGSSRVMLTDSRRVARMWMTAKSRHDGWDKMRRSVPWSRVDHWKCKGVTFLEGDPIQERELLDELVERWAYPMQSIAGIEEVEPGVWHVQGGTVTPGVVRVGPLWLGRGSAGAVVGRKCIVGPSWFADSEPIGRKSGIMKIGLREIEEIEIWDDPETQDPLSPPRRGYVAMKRLFDVVGSAFALLVFLPVMLAIGFMILVEDGWPVLYGQRRQGKNGRVFKCWKFRTMVRGAHLMAKQLKQNDGPQIYIPNDPRVLKCGKLLRKLHLDELPQFWNVLVGQMSLVGPRPSPDDENQFCPAWRDSRLSVRPGITGLWQLKRKRQQGEDFQEWIKYDMEYVQRAGMRFDLEILFRTAVMMVVGRKDSVIAESSD